MSLHGLLNCHCTVEPVWNDNGARLEAVLSSQAPCCFGSGISLLMFVQACPLTSSGKSTPEEVTDEYPRELSSNLIVCHVSWHTWWSTILSLIKEWKTAFNHYIFPFLSMLEISVYSVNQLGFRFGGIAFRSQTTVKPSVCFSVG